MSTAPSSTDIEYPESDGQPMGETDLHIDWLFRLRDMLKFRYQGRQVYVAADLLLYYEPGFPYKFVVPDAFVVKDCDPGQRRTYKIWEEPSPPHVIFEITSRSSKREDTLNKPKTYANIGVREYFIYDPTEDYLDPPLQGFRLQQREYVPIEPDAEGWRWSEELGIKCRLERGELILADAQTGQQLLMQWEAEQQARHAEQQARQAEQRAREAEQRAREASEAEVEKLREQLRKLQQPNGE